MCKIIGYFPKRKISKGKATMIVELMCPRRLFLGHCERTGLYKGKRNTFRLLWGLTDVSFQHRMPHYILAALCACVEGTKELIPLLGTMEHPLTSHCSLSQTTALVLFSANVLSSLLNTCYSTWLNFTVLALNLQCQGALQMFLLDVSERRTMMQYNQCLQRLGTRWSWSFLPTQIILIPWFSRAFLIQERILIYFNFVLLSNSSSSFIDNALKTSTGAIRL